MGIVLSTANKDVNVRRDLVVNLTVLLSVQVSYVG